eukprot:scaffold8471_cov184-Amphora_coffeaeformis.AAC.20
MDSGEPSNGTEKLPDGNEVGSENDDDPTQSQANGGSASANTPTVEVDQGVGDDSDIPEPKRRKNLGINDVVRATPLEEEAETFLLEAIENRDPFNSHEDQDLAMLEHVPEGTEALFSVEFETEEDPGAAARNSTGRSNPISLREDGGTTQEKLEDTLFGLTTALSAMQFDSNNAEVEDLSNSSVSETDMAGTINLIHRGKKKTAVTVDADGASVRLASSPDNIDTPTANLLAVEMGSDRIASQGYAQSVGSTSQAGRPWYGITSQPLLKYLQEKTIVIQDVRAFWGQKSRSIFVRVRAMLSYLVLPMVTTAVLLFYLGENPPTGRIDVRASFNETIIDTGGNLVNLEKASASWWLLFITRQIVLLGLAKVTEIFLIDFLCLGVKWASFLFGPFLILLIVQSRGWPFLATTWSIYATLLLYGDKRFSRHWLYFQDVLDVFNEANPSGEFVNNDLYYRVLLIAICVGPIVTLKRLYMGLFLGRKSFATYAEDLARVMRKVLLVTQTASLARQLEFQADARGRSNASFQSQLRSIYEHAETATTTGSSRTTTAESGQKMETQHSRGLLLDPANRNRVTGGLSKAQKAKISELLGDWEEPTREGTGSIQNISISSILQFRQSVAFLDASYIFGVAFGVANTRARCIESTQNLYRQLLLDDPGSLNLDFQTIAHLALRTDDTLDEQKTNALIRLFRPDREGKISLLDFVKSVDTVYKEARLLRASIRNSRRLDKAFEGIISAFLYVLIWAISLALLGIDPLALFLAFSPVILGFTFMFGASAAKFFEGILFILIRKPYEIGDRINVSSPSSDSCPSGSPGWVVADISLFHTTVVYGTTNERATLANGSLAGTRVLNMAQSPRALLYVYVKFGVAVQYDKIVIFEEALRKFVLARPREWLNMLGFRMTKFEADLGYQEYVVILQHRESWQNIGALLSSKAQVSAFCLELSKKMDMRYKNPLLPIDLSMSKIISDSTESSKGGHRRRPTRTAEETREILSEFGAAEEEHLRIEDLVTLFAQKKNE